MLLLIYKDWCHLLRVAKIMSLSNKQMMALGLSLVFVSQKSFAEQYLMLLKFLNKDLQ